MPIRRTPVGDIVGVAQDAPGDYEGNPARPDSIIFMKTRYRLGEHPHKERRGRTQ